MKGIKIITKDCLTKKRPEVKDCGREVLVENCRPLKIFYP